MLEFRRIYIGYDQSEYKYKKGESRGYWTGRGWIIRTSDSEEILALILADSTQK